MQNGVGELVKIGSGKLYLTGSNSYSGHTTISGGVLSGNSIAKSGFPSSFGAGSSIDLTNGATLEYTGLNGLTDRTLTIAPGVGTIEANFGVLQLDGIVNGLGSLRKVGPGALRLTYQGNSYGGATMVDGGKLETGNSEVIPNASHVTVASSARLDFNGFDESINSLTSAGELKLNYTTILTTNSTSTPSTLNGLLSIHVGGTTQDQYGQLHVAGQLNLGGVLSLTFVNGFVPQPGDSFDLLDWGLLAGTFSSLQLPVLVSGRQWSTSQLYATGLISVVDTGDFNTDGIVNAADYVVWRKGNGTTYTQSDYNTWRAHFGDTAGAGANVSDLRDTFVPEPTTAVIAFPSLAFFILQRYVRSRRSTLTHALEQDRRRS